jgi:hypothetical protein
MPAMPATTAREVLHRAPPEMASATKTAVLVG